MRRLDLYAKSRKVQRKQSQTLDTGNCLENIRARLGGEFIARGNHSILKTEQFIPKEHVHGMVHLADVYSVETDFLSVLFPLFGEFTQRRSRGLNENSPEASSRIPLKDLLFFDIETTGLSGGAGTHLFLAGFLRIENKGFRIVQYFLNNLSSELLYLEEIGKELFPYTLLVSYNGRSYDYNIMKNRYIMGGLPFFEHDPVHLDLLYTSRRIWKGHLPDFTLSTVEMRALDFARTGDIPGWQIPDVYASYLRGRNVADDLTAIFQHNKNDVLTLLGLLIKQMSLVRNAAADTAQTERYNPIAISDMFITGGKMKSARDILRAHSKDSGALKRLALLYKREGSFEKALSHLERLGSQRVELSDYMFACTEAAKIYEHVYKDFDKALVYTMKMQARLDRVQLFYSQHGSRIKRERDLIMKRKGRLQRKLERKEG
jgi:uncharacterized protein YprB with RNaseH-like and TPR domain